MDGSNVGRAHRHWLAALNVKQDNRLAAVECAYRLGEGPADRDLPRLPVGVRKRHDDLYGCKPVPLTRKFAHHVATIPSRNRSASRLAVSMSGQSESHSALSA